MNNLINGCGLMEMWVWLLSLECCATSHAQTEFSGCKTMALRFFSELELPDSPSQPTGINFPKRSFGKAKIVYHSLSGWSKQWKWLHYYAAQDIPGYLSTTSYL